MLINNLPVFNDEKGSLIPVEFSILPFQPVRTFWTNKVPKGATRGNHAHFKTKQIVFCVKGKIKVDLYDGTTWQSGVLEENNYTFIDSLIWDSQTYLTGDDSLLVMCSTTYNPKDYIFDIKDFERIKKEKIYADTSDLYS